MDIYGKGLVFAAALLGALAMSAVLVAGPKGSAAETEAVTENAAVLKLAGSLSTEPPTEKSAETTAAEDAVPVLAMDAALAETETAKGMETAPAEMTGALAETVASEASPPTPCYYVSLVTGSGELVELRELTGELLQQTTADANGYAVLQPIAPGCYTLRQGTNGGDFQLLENAAVEALSGTLWSDGELLHLEAAETVCLTVECGVSQADRGKVVTLTLTDKRGNCYDRSFIAGNATRCTVAFQGLQPGRYALCRNGKLLRTLSVTGAAEQFLSLLD